MRRLILFGLVPFLTAALPTSWPLGTYIHDHQRCGTCFTVQDTSGWDTVENPGWGAPGNSTPQENLNAMTAQVPTYPVGLWAGVQPAALADGTPGGSCPNGGGSFTTANLSHLPNVVLSAPTSPASGVSGTAKLVNGCDFRRAFGADGNYTLSTGVKVVLVNSFISGRIDTNSAGSGGIWIFHATQDGPNTGEDYAIRAAGDSSVYIHHSEILGGEDTAKLGNNDWFVANHFHGNSNTSSQGQPHYDGIQCYGTANDSGLLDNTLMGPFRDTQNAFRCTGTGADIGNIMVSGNVLGGGSSRVGNRVVQINGDPFSGFAAYWGNRILCDDNADVGPSWQAGPALECGSRIPNTSCFVEDNECVDGSTSGTNGNAAPSGYGGKDDDTWTDSWTTDVDVSNGGSYQPMTQALKDLADAWRTTFATWDAEILAAAGLGSAAVTTISSAVPNTGVPGQDVTLQFSTVGFGTLTDADIHCTGANTFDQDLSGPAFSPATIPGASLANAGTTSCTVEATDGTLTDTSEPTTLVFAAASATLTLTCTPTTPVGTAPYTIDVACQIGGTETGTASADLYCTTDDNSPTTTSGIADDAAFSFTGTPDCSYTAGNTYRVVLTQNSRTVTYSSLVTVTGAPPQVLTGQVCFYDTTQPQGEQKTTACIVDGLMFDRDFVGAQPNVDFPTTEYPHVGTYAGPACLDMAITYPPLATGQDLDQTTIPYGMLGDQGFLNSDLGIIRAAVTVSPASFATDGLYNVTATPHEVESTGNVCTGGDSGATVSYDFRIADLTMVSVTPAIPNDTESFVVAYNESGFDAAICQADCNGDGTFGDDVVDETAEEATCPALPVGIYDVGIGCTMAGLSGVVTETIPVTVIPAAAGSTVFKRPVRIVP